MKYQLQFLPEDDFFIFHYVRLLDQYGHFQMDFLLLSRCFHLIMEVKNIHYNMHFGIWGRLTGS
nr:nuclease-related domain-containing protein [Lentibacillus halodurans]